MSSLPAIACDHSHYQPAMDSSFTRDFDIAKCTQGVTYLDSKWDENSAVAARLFAEERLSGLVAYHVFSIDDPAAQFRKIVAAISRGGPPPDWLAGVMIDLESWAGTSYALHGDHSANINRLGGMLAGWLKSWRAVWLYANDYDRQTLAPNRDIRMPFHLAAYTSELRFKNIKGAIGQQYSDGQTKWSVPTINGIALPRYTAPFGYADHNVFPGFANGRALREWMRPLGTDPLEEIMAFYKDRADYEAAMLRLMQKANENVGNVRHVRYVDLVLDGDDDQLVRHSTMVNRALAARGLGSNPPESPRPKPSHAAGGN